MTMTKTDLKASGLEVIGYRGIFSNRGKYIPADEALEYALEQCGVVVDARAPDAKEFLDMMVDWYFSGAWILEYGYPEGGTD